MMTFAHTLTAYTVLGMAGLLGEGTMMIFMLMLYVGPLELVDLGLAETTVLWLDACLCLGFFVQHSVMIRRSFRQRLARFLPTEYEAAFFAIVSGVALMILIVFWQQSSYTIVAARGMMRWLLRGVFFLSLVCFAWSWYSLGAFEPFGCIPILDHLRGVRRPPLPFTVRGPYRWVRHPLYILLLLMIWSYPDPTADRLLFNVLFTAWIIIGTILEERDLVASFGQAYVDYKTNVPMLIPYQLAKSQTDRRGVRM